MENVKETKQEEKIVNLFEDMNFHEHDSKSYEKMIHKQKIDAALKQAEQSEK